MYMWVGKMKTNWTIAAAIVLTFLLAVPAMAIDTKPKSGTSSSTAKSSDSASVRSVKKADSKKKSNKSLLERLKRDVRESSKKSDDDKYDNYIDKNKDGVDDRVATKQKARETDDSKREPEPAAKSDDKPDTSKRKKPR